MENGLTRAMRTAWGQRTILGWVGFALAVLLLVALAVQQIRLVGDFRVDDAYITFSFSKNLAAGNGPIFSHGVRVEGYSNFLWMVIVAIAYWVAPNADPYQGARAFAGLFLLGALIAVYRIVRPVAGTRAAFAALALMLSNTDVMRATLSGLETIPFTACIVLGWASYVRAEPARTWHAPAWLSAAALMRIDGFVPLLILLGFEFISALSERRLRIMSYLRWALPAVGVWVAYFSWRTWYYGLWLPTTYYAKTMVAQNEPDRGFNQLWGFYRDYGLLALLPLLAIPLFRAPQRQAWGVALAAVLQIGYASLTGGDWMPFERFLLPAFPMLAVLVGWGLSCYWREIRHFPLFPRLAAGLTLCALFAFSAKRMHASYIDSTEEEFKLSNAAHVANHTHENLLKNTDLVRAIVRHPGQRLVTDYAGVFSVYTDAAIIDMWGLCTKEIALEGDTATVNPIYGKSCAKCYAVLNPDYFHVGVPIVRTRNAFSNQQQVIQDIFHGPEIDPVIHLSTEFVTGRLEQPATGRVLWFLEKRRPGMSYAPRSAGPGLQIDYPFL